MQRLMRFLEPATAALDPELARTRYRGTLLGLAVGNALGLQAEGLSRSEVEARFPEGIREIPPAEQQRPWDDDVAQAIELGETLLMTPFDPDAFLGRLLVWEAENGRGVGRQTHRVLLEARSGARGTAAAKNVWEQSNRSAAGNGAVMRCAPVALRWRRDPLRLIEDAERSAKITHFDPRCTWTTVAVCSAFCHALAGTDWSLLELGESLADAGAPGEVVLAMRKPATPDLAALELDEPRSMGYTIRTMTVALWALQHDVTFEKALVDIVNAGGDTDSNGAVAGAALGARFGTGEVPDRWIGALRDTTELLSLADRLLDAADRTQRG